CSVQRLVPATVLSLSVSARLNAAGLAYVWSGLTAPVLPAAAARRPVPARRCAGPCVPVPAPATETCRGRRLDRGATAAVPSRRLGAGRTWRRGLLGCRRTCRGS